MLPPALARRGGLVLPPHPRGRCLGLNFWQRTLCGHDAFDDESGFESERRRFLLLLCRAPVPRPENIGMLFRLLRAIILEWSMIFKLDSPFLDSPLNEEGIEQALELRKYIETDQEGLTEKQKNLINIVRGTEGTSIVVSSTLRRAIATTTLALWPRIKRRSEKISLLSYLQEISRPYANCPNRSEGFPREIFHHRAK